MADKPIETNAVAADAAPRASGGFLRSVRAFFGAKPNEVSLRESLEEAIDVHEEGSDTVSLGDKEREMLFNVLEYGELRIDDVMVPRGDIVAVPSNISFPDLVKVFAEAAHSRMPVFGETLDDVVGMVHVKDALKLIAGDNSPDEFKIAAIQRPVLYVPASMRVIDLLAKMRASRTHMAVVVDEYGGTDGLVTVEDMVEEIVGEIEDEHDTVDEPDLVPLKGGSFDADARVDIAEVEETLGADLTLDERSEDVDTLGGLVFLLVDHVPDIGEVITHDSGYRFEILDADPRRIRKIRIHPAAKSLAMPVKKTPESSSESPTESASVRKPKTTPKTTLKNTPDSKPASTAAEGKGVQPEPSEAP